MEKASLDSIIEMLENLYANLYIAKRTKDKRKIQAKINKAKEAIVTYKRSLPDDVIAYLEEKVNPDVMSFQWAEDDIVKCIEALKRW